VRDARAGGATITISDASGRKVRTLRGPAQAGLNSAAWDMRFDSAMPGSANSAPTAGGRGGGRGGDGGGSGLAFAGAEANAGPLVAPGQYMVSVAIQNVAAPLRGQVTVSGDPLEKLSSADRQARQLAIMEVYDLQKTLFAAQAAVQSLVAQGADVKLDVAAGGVAAAAQADSTLKVAAQTQAEVNRLIGVTGSLMRALESFSTPPTTAQRQQIGWTYDDATRALTTLNRASQNTLPALYSRYGGSAKPRTIPPVALPARRGSGG